MQPKTHSTNTGILVQGSTAETIKEARRAVMEVVSSAAGDDVKITALEALRTICSNGQISIANTNIVVGESPSPKNA